MNKKPAAPTSVVDIADYQPGSIVSHILLKQEKGNVTFFAFDKDQELSEHTAPFDALLQVLEGAAEVTIAGCAHRVKGGEFIRLPAHQPHAVRAVERFKMLLIMIRA